MTDLYCHGSFYAVLESKQHPDREDAKQHVVKRYNGVTKYLVTEFPSGNYSRPKKIKD